MSGRAKSASGRLGRSKRAASSKRRLDASIDPLTQWDAGVIVDSIGNEKSFASSAGLHSNNSFEGGIGGDSATVAPHVRKMRAELIEKQMDTTKKKIRQLEDELLSLSSEREVATESLMSQEPFNRGMHSAQKSFYSSVSSRKSANISLKNTVIREGNEVFNQPPRPKSTASSKRTSRSRRSGRPASGSVTIRDEFKSPTKASVLASYEQTVNDRFPIRPASSPFHRYPTAHPQAPTDSPGPKYEVTNGEDYLRRTHYKHAFPKEDRQKNLGHPLLGQVEYMRPAREEELTPAPGYYEVKIDLTRPHHPPPRIAQSNVRADWADQCSPGPAAHFGDSKIIQRKVTGPKYAQPTFSRFRQHAMPSKLSVKQINKRRSKSPSPSRSKASERYALLLKNVSRDRLSTSDENSNPNTTARGSVHMNASMNSVASTYSQYNQYFGGILSEPSLDLTFGKNNTSEIQESDAGLAKISELEASGKQDFKSTAIESKLDSLRYAPYAKIPPNSTNFTPFDEKTPQKVYKYASQGKKIEDGLEEDRKERASITASMLFSSYNVASPKHSASA